MSGRNLQGFIKNYRAEDAERQRLQMINGSSRCKPTEYETLQAFVDARRLEYDLIGQKVLKTCCAAKATKESSLLRQHRQVWSRECPRLQKAEEQAEEDIHHFLNQIKPNDITDTAIFLLQQYGESLEREREAFRISTVEPVHQLRDDLSFRLGRVDDQQLNEHPSNWEQVKQQINFVKDQQTDIIGKLNAEYQDTEQQIMDLGLEKYISSTSDIVMSSETIPEEVLDSECPYPDLMDSLIQAFQFLSQRYQGRLQSLKEQLEKTDKFCGWCPDDHQQFQFTVSMYTHDIPNYRALCMDMLLRQFPDRTRLELMQHERLWDVQRFTQTQIRVVTQQWQRDLQELLDRALVTLQEAKHAHQEELEHHRDRQHQQDICFQLREKLQQWRAQQEEVAKLESAIEARRQEEEEERLKKEQEKEAALRSQQKEKRLFYLKQQRRREVLEQRDQERLAALRSVMEEQARRDRQRVQFRTDVLQQRIKEREMQELQQQREEQERRDRLEALRKQVEVLAEADPERMMADTEAWRSRHLNEKQFELQRPLFSINTYTDKQIASDPRVRAEQAFREAGVHQNQYAKEVLSQIKPTKPPRHDTKSTLKF
ncbi:coiled-coil domain-containing protein 148-like isoform X2 [Girardinichthys multiradiatus]|uniref:coiled-coil domain-containing protein 148-like isoform X2 n=1 Tax=Girardinichthys multiradiatus TaxID=208333 RepID=UPI001FAD1334|nr:coiled-coil domain-containing protein 148-like isoform X2 [Girardinichthys multiradiatus]